MDRAPQECRKSLDQLLEQAMAERSREDDQVEVTYEMREDYSDGQRPVCLKPGDPASTPSPSKKDEIEEENEAAVGSVKMERKVKRNNIVLSLVVVFCFSGFSVIQSLLSTAIPRTGLIVTGILYLLAALSCLFAPNVNQKIGEKWIIAGSALMPITLVVAFHFKKTFGLVISAIALGISLGPSYRAQTTYLFKNVSRLSFLTQAVRSEVQQRFFIGYFILSKSYSFWGHLIASMIVEYVHVSVEHHPNTSIDTSEKTSTIARRINICASTQCKHVFLSTEYNVPSDQNNSPSGNLISPFVTELFVYFFTVASTVGIVVAAVFLEQFRVLQEQDPLERPLLFQTLRQIKLLIIDRNVRLVVAMIIFTGIEQGFIFGYFTRDYISCALGIESIVFIMLCLGGCHTLGSIGVHVFSQHFQRPIIMAAGLVCQSGLLMVLWLWAPVKDDAAVFYVIAGGWGLCNAVWETLSISFLTIAFPDDWQTPVCFYYQLQWFGMAMTYLFSNWLCPHIKILILAVFLAVAIIPYTILEFRIHHQNQLQNRTAML